MENFVRLSSRDINQVRAMDKETNQEKQGKKAKKRYWRRKKKNTNKNTKTLPSSDKDDELFFVTYPKFDFSALPVDIMDQILNRLEIKDVARCKCVCKQWNSLIRQENFTQRHVARWRDFLCEYGFTRYVEGCSSDQEFQVIAGGYGILVERFCNGDGCVKYRARNPATRQVLCLPSPRFTTNHQIALCYAYKSNSYKLISIYYYEKYDNSGRQGGCEILTLGTRNCSWRGLDVPTLHDLDREKEIIKLNQQYPSHYALHLVRITTNLARVVSIDLENECAFINTVPQGSFSNFNYVSQFSSFSDMDKASDFCWNANPGFAEVVNKELHVIFLEDFTRHKFSEKKIIPFSFIGVSWGKIVAMLSIGDRVLFETGKIKFMYNIKTLEREDVTMKLNKSNNNLNRKTRKQRTDSHQGSYSLLTFKGMQNE